jgi:hypothetical protein
MDGADVGPVYLPPQFIGTSGIFDRYSKLTFKVACSLVREGNRRDFLQFARVSTPGNKLTVFLGHSAI